jgi:hypothetical protein
MVQARGCGPIAGIDMRTTPPALSSNYCVGEIHNLKFLPMKWNNKMLLLCDGNRNELTAAATTVVANKRCTHLQTHTYT